jgi:hypothetical protein
VGLVRREREVDEIRVEAVDAVPRVGVPAVAAALLADELRAAKRASGVPSMAFTSGKTCW